MHLENFLIGKVCSARFTASLAEALYVDSVSGFVPLKIARCQRPIYQKQSARRFRRQNGDWPRLEFMRLGHRNNFWSAPNPVAMVFCCDRHGLDGVGEQMTKHGDAGHVQGSGCGRPCIEFADTLRRYAWRPKGPCISNTDNLRAMVAKIVTRVPRSVVGINFGTMLLCFHDGPVFFPWIHSITEVEG